MTDTQRAKPAQQLARAREAIIAQMDRLQQQIANLDEQISKLAAQVNGARAEHGAFRDALNALGPAPLRRRKANGAAAPKRGRTQPAQPALIPAAD